MFLQEGGEIVSADACYVFDALSIVVLVRLKQENALWAIGIVIAVQPDIAGLDLGQCLLSCIGACKHELEAKSIALARIWYDIPALALEIKKNEVLCFFGIQHREYIGKVSNFHFVDVLAGVLVPQMLGVCPRAAVVNALDCSASISETRNDPSWNHIEFDFMELAAEYIGDVDILFFALWGSSNIPNRIIRGRDNICSEDHESKPDLLAKPFCE